MSIPKKLKKELYETIKKTVSEYQNNNEPTTFKLDKKFFKELDPILEKIYKAKDTKTFKTNWHNMMKLFVSNGMPYGELETETKDLERSLPFLWTSGGGTSMDYKISQLLEQRDEYEAHLSDNFNIPLSISRALIKKLSDHPGFVDSIINRISKDNIAYFKLMSEVFAEHFHPESLRDLKIEFGQNLYKKNKELIGIRPDACMFESELPIILLRASNYNIDLERLKQASNKLREINRKINHSKDSKRELEGQLSRCNESIRDYENRIREFHENIRLEKQAKKRGNKKSTCPAKLLEKLKTEKLEKEREKSRILTQKCKIEKEISLGEIAKIRRDNPTMNSESTRIDLTRSVTYEYYEGDKKPVDGTLILLPTYEGNVLNNLPLKPKIKINISELQLFVERATRKKGEELTIKETLSAMRAVKTKEGTNPLSTLITDTMIAKADSTKISMPTQIYSTVEKTREVLSAKKNE